MIKYLSKFIFIDKNMFLSGIKTSFPVAISFFTVSATIGIYAGALQFPPMAVIFMSLLVFAGASQFSAINLYIIGATPWEIIITTFIINIRNFMMSTALTRKIDQKISFPFSLILSFGITDATYALLYFHKKQIFQPSYILGVNLFAHFCWILGTTFGVVFGKHLPVGIKHSIGIAIYALFIGLLVPEIKKSKIGFAISLIAISINIILLWTVSTHHLTFGWRFIISVISSTIIGLIIFPEEEQENNDK